MPKTTKTLNPIGYLGEGAADLQSSQVLQSPPTAGVNHTEGLQPLQLPSGSEALIQFIADLAILQLAEETSDTSLLQLLSPAFPVEGETR